MDMRAAESAGLDYLKRELGPRAPQYIILEGEFNEAPLEGEGHTLLFSFDLEPGPGAAAACPQPPDRKHYLAMGETTPNYFPAYGLALDDLYSFHIGTRFLLEMGIQRVDSELEPPGAREGMRIRVAQVAPNAAIEHEELAALFRNDEDYYAVYRLRVGGEDVYFFGADCPPGFYRMTQHPPQAALRLHLGKLIRAEARQAAPENS